MQDPATIFRLLNGVGIYDRMPPDALSDRLATILDVNVQATMATPMFAGSNRISFVEIRRTEKHKKYMNDVHCASLLDPCSYPSFILSNWSGEPSAGLLPRPSSCRCSLPILQEDAMMKWRAGEYMNQLTAVTTAHSQPWPQESLVECVRIAPSDSLISTEPSVSKFDSESAPSSARASMYGLRTGRNRLMFALNIEAPCVYSAERDLRGSEASMSSNVAQFACIDRLGKRLRLGHLRFNNDRRLICVNCISGALEEPYTFGQDLEPSKNYKSVSTGQYWGGGLWPLKDSDSETYRATQDHH
jgi:hypothetical protein